MRLDQYLVKHHGYSRNRAQMIISDGHVFVNQKPISKSAHKVGDSDTIIVQDNPLGEYVSRSALKLKWFLESHSDIDIQDQKCLDVGSSTGWFTQVLLEKWAQSVYSVDVGSDQLHESIKSDKRVISHQQTDIRDFFDRISSQQAQSIQTVTIDVSFISVTKVLPTLWEHLSPDTGYIILFKPQFEVGKEYLTKTGVVKDQKYTHRALENFKSFCSINTREVVYIEQAEVIWEAGNQEWMIYI